MIYPPLRIQQILNGLKKYICLLLIKNMKCLLFNKIAQNNLKNTTGGNCEAVNGSQKL